jgi:restriction system protein
MTNAWCVRANFGSYASQFTEHGYVAIGWLEGQDLSALVSREQIYPLYQQAHPKNTSAIVIGQQVGQIARFLLEIAAGDVVITPDANTELLGLKSGLVLG